MLKALDPNGAAKPDTVGRQDGANGSRARANYSSINFALEFLGQRGQENRDPRRHGA